MSGWTVNGVYFWSAPSMCGACDFLTIDKQGRYDNCLGHCRLFNEMHRPHSYVPARCRKLWNKAQRLTKDEGEDEVMNLVIVINE